MSNLLIRDLDDDVLLRLTKMAKAKGVSRSEFLREQLTLLAEFPELLEKDEKYEKLFNRMLPIQEKTIAMLERNHEDLRKTEMALSAVLELLNINE